MSDSKFSKPPPSRGINNKSAGATRRLASFQFTDVRAPEAVKTPQQQQRRPTTCQKIVRGAPSTSTSRSRSCYKKKASVIELATLPLEKVAVFLKYDALLVLSTSNKFFLASINNRRSTLFEATVVKARQSQFIEQSWPYMMMKLNKEHRWIERLSIGLSENDDEGALLVNAKEAMFQTGNCALLFNRYAK